jgi:uncharacterized protein
MNKLIGKLFSGIVKGYQITLGAVFGGRCRYYPTCSEYARQTLSRDGALKGIAKTAWRLLRCNPWSRGGYDPV